MTKDKRRLISSRQVDETSEHQVLTLDKTSKKKMKGKVTDSLNLSVYFKSYNVY